MLSLVLFFFFFYIFVFDFVLFIGQSKNFFSSCMAIVDDEGSEPLYEECWKRYASFISFMNLLITILFSHFNFYVLWYDLITQFWDHLLSEGNQDVHVCNVYG